MKEIELLGEAYAQQLNPQKVAPFPHEIVTHLYQDLNIFFADLENPTITGVTLYEPDEKTYSVLINSEKQSSHQHFALAHSLGHYFLHKDVLQKEKGLIDKDTLFSAQGQLESEANCFALSLLMPQTLVEEAWGATTDIERCAKIFNVPTVAMSVRLAGLGLIS